MNIVSKDISIQQINVKVIIGISYCDTTYKFYSLWSGIEICDSQLGGSIGGGDSK